MAVSIWDKDLNQEALSDILNSLLVDITAIASKLDDDAWVTDTDYEAGLTTTV